MKRRILLTLAVALVLLLPVALLAQTTADEELAKFLGLDEVLVLGIMTIFGIGIMAITQLLKNLFKVSTWTDLARKYAGYGFSLVVSLGAAAFILAKAGTFTWTLFAVYGIYCWGVANGFWKSLKVNRGPSS